MGARASGKSLSAGLAKREHSIIVIAGLALVRLLADPTTLRTPGGTGSCSKVLPWSAIPKTQVKSAVGLTFRSFAGEG